MSNTKPQAGSVLTRGRGGGVGEGWRRCRSRPCWKWCRCTRVLINVLLKYEYWMRLWVEGEVGEGVKMGRKLRDGDGRKMDFSLFFLWRTENCCAVMESGDGWCLRSRTSDGTNVGHDLDLWSRRLTQAGKARDWNRRVQDGDIWECVAATLTTLACSLRFTLDACKVSHWYYPACQLCLIIPPNPPFSWSVLEHLRQYLNRSLFSWAVSGTPSCIQILCRVPLG